MCVVFWSGTFKERDLTLGGNVQLNWIIYKAGKGEFICLRVRSQGGLL